MRTLYFIRYAALLALVAGTPAFAQTLENSKPEPAAFNREPMRLATTTPRGRIGGEVRNELLKKASTSKTFKDIREEGRDVRQDLRENRHEIMGQMRNDRKETMEKLRDMKGSTTTAIRKDMRQSMHMNELAMRMTLIVRQLNVRIDALNKINDKVIARIAKIAAQKVDVTKVNTLEKTAAYNLQKAIDAVNALASYKPATSTVTTSTSTEIKLDKPRAYAQTAIEAIKDAQKSIRDVIVELKKSSKGLKSEKRKDSDEEVDISDQTSTSSAQ